VAHNLSHLDTMFSSHVCAEDVNLHVHALQWASGAQTLLPYMLRGARTVILDESVFDPAAVVDALADEQVTGALIPGPMLTAILDAIEQRGSFRHRIRRLVTLFATPEQLERTTELLGGPVWSRTRCHRARCAGDTSHFGRGSKCAQAHGLGGSPRVAVHRTRHRRWERIAPAPRAARRDRGAQRNVHERVLAGLQCRGRRIPSRRLVSLA
jgi:hypothetical protein